SSRRRHTRFSRDWSSDVCSSDLRIEMNVRTLLLIISLVILLASGAAYGVFTIMGGPLGAAGGGSKEKDGPGPMFEIGTLIVNLRSEERRVGKQRVSHRGPNE